VRLRRLVAACLCLLAPLVAAAGERPARVASMNLASDEVLVELLPPARLVSVTRWADEASTSNVAGRAPASAYRFAKTDLEQLVALTPDLVVVSEFTDADFLRLLERSGMKSYRMRGLDSLAGIRAAILDLGSAVGEPEGAQRLVARYDATLAEVAHALSGAPRPRVLYWSGGMTAGSDTAIGAIIEAAGAVNLGRELGVVGVAPPGSERAFVADPDFILVGNWPQAVEALKTDPLIGQTRAVREGHVIVMPDHLLVALSQYTADAVRDLAARLHPDRVRPRKP